MTVKCSVCEELLFDENGKPIKETLIYQKIGDELRLAKEEMVLGIPLVFKHKECVHP